MMQKPSRPTGIAVLAILELIAGIIFLIGGAFLAALGGSSMLAAYGMGAFSGIIAIFGGVLAVVGIITIIVGWGLWSGKGWAWTLAVVLSALGVVFSLVGLIGGQASDIVGLIIDALILWYLFRPHVKTYFGKGMAMSQPAPTMQAPPAPTPSPAQ
jgi:lysylphosphatidylglycerol synthetase-like protein (DUF2156 family)